MLGELVGGDLGRASHVVDELHEAGVLEALDLVGREADADVLPVELRDRGRQGREFART